MLHMADLEPKNAAYPRDSRLRRPPEVGLPVNPRPSRQERPLAPPGRSGGEAEGKRAFRGKRPNLKGGPRGARGGDPDVRRGPWPSGRPCAIWNPTEVELFLKLLELKFARGKAPPLSDSRLRRPPEVGPPVNPRPSRQERPLAPQAGAGGKATFPREKTESQGGPRGGPEGAILT